MLITKPRTWAEHELGHSKYTQVHRHLASCLFEESAELLLVSAVMVPRSRGRDVVDPDVCAW